METKHYLMPRKFCGARTRAGGTCKQPAMKNGRCRLHGGKSKSGAAHGQYIHGMRSKEMIEHRRQMRAILKGAMTGLMEIAENGNVHRI